MVKVRLQSTRSRGTRAIRRPGVPNVVGQIGLPLSVRHLSLLPEVSRQLATILRYVRLSALTGASYLLLMERHQLTR